MERALPGCIDVNGVILQALSLLAFVSGVQIRVPPDISWTRSLSWQGESSPEDHMPTSPPLPLGDDDEIYDVSVGFGGIRRGFVIC